MYNSYEEYMQKVLGMNMPNTYMQNNNDMMYQQRTYNSNFQEVNKLYPEIYNIIYPMVQKCFSMRNIVALNENQVNEMVEEIYNAVETRETPQTRDSNVQQKNGDVKNPRIKEPPRQNNYLLRDLIRILIINEFVHGGSCCNTNRPQFPPNMNQNMGGFNPGGMPPIMRPGM